MSTGDLPGKAQRSARKAGASGRRAGRQASNSRGLRILAGAGFAAKGLLYLIIGYIALQIAFGEGSGEEADNSGALQMIAGGTAGMVVLWSAVVGLAALTVWHSLNALVSPGKASKRIASAVRAITCGVLTLAIGGYLMGQGSPESQDDQSEALTAQLMSLPFGRLVVGAVGCAVIAVGAYQVWKAVNRRFLKDLRLFGVTKTGRDAVVAIGVLGITTHGLVLGTAGVFFVLAAVRFDEEEAEGLDGTLRSFAETPVGPWALVAVAVGVVLYGAYCFCQARWQRD